MTGWRTMPGKAVWWLAGYSTALVASVWGFNNLVWLVAVVAPIGLLLPWFSDKVDDRLWRNRERALQALAARREP